MNTPGILSEAPNSLYLMEPWVEPIAHLTLRRTCLMIDNVKHEIFHKISQSTSRAKKTAPKVVTNQMLSTAGSLLRTTSTSSDQSKTRSTNVHGNLKHENFQNNMPKYFPMEVKTKPTGCALELPDSMWFQQHWMDSIQQVNIKKTISKSNAKKVH